MVMVRINTTTILVYVIPKTGGGRMKRILVSLPDRVHEIIQGELKGKMGENGSEIVRAIVIAYLSEKGYMEKEKQE